MITNLLSALGWIPNIFLPCKQVRRHIGAIFVQRRLRARNTCWITCANTQESRHIAAHTARRRLRARSILRITYISTRVRHHRSSSGGQSCTATYTHTHTHTKEVHARKKHLLKGGNMCSSSRVNRRRTVAVHVWNHVELCVWTLSHPCAGAIWSTPPPQGAPCASKNTLVCSMSCDAVMINCVVTSYIKWNSVIPSMEHELYPILFYDKFRSIQSSFCS